MKSIPKQQRNIIKGAQNFSSVKKSKKRLSKAFQEQNRNKTKRGNS